MSLPSTCQPLPGSLTTNLTGWQNDKRQEIILPEKEIDPDYCPTVDDTEGEYFVLVNEWFSYMKINVSNFSRDY